MQAIRILWNYIIRLGESKIDSERRKYENRFTKTTLSEMQKHSHMLNICLTMGQFSYTDEQDWGSLFNSPIENVQDVTYTLYIRALKEKNSGKKYVLSLHPAYVQSKMIFFICDNMRLGNIKSYDKIIGREELQKKYENYTNIVLYYKDCMLSDVNNNADFMEATNDLLNAHEEFKCSINPAAVMSFLYTSPAGKTFLPQSLVAYIEENNIIQEEVKLANNITNNITNSHNITNITYNMENNYSTTITAPTDTAKNNLSLRDIFLQYRTILQYYNTHLKSRKNDALVERVSLLLHSIDTKLAKECEIVLPADYQGDGKSKNKSQNLKIAEETDIPTLKKLFPSLPDLPKS